MTWNLLDPLTSKFSILWKEVGISGDANQMGSRSVQIDAISTDWLGRANMVKCAI